MPFHDNRYRFAANHHHARELASRPMTKPRRATSPAVDGFRPVSAARAASVAYLGSRGLVSPAVGYGSPYQGVVQSQDYRRLSQARLLSDRDRRRIEGARTPAAEPAIGRSVVSPIVALGGSDY